MTDHLLSVIENLGRPRVLVVGDLMLDRYVWGTVDRISQEAPIIVVAVVREEQRLGGAGIVVGNLVSLDCDVACVSVLGEDRHAQAVRGLLADAGVSDDAVICDPSRPTTVKERVIARVQQVVRIDYEHAGELPTDISGAVIQSVERELPRCDIVLVEDYGKGLLSPHTLQQVFRLARRAGKRTVVDPIMIPDYSRYRGASIITPNRSETAAATGIKPTDEDAWRRAASRLITDLDLEAAIITLDSDGIFAASCDGATCHVPARARSVYDVSGAGDTVLATIGAALASGASLQDAVALANHAGGIVVERLTVATTTRRELAERLGERGHLLSTKIKLRKELPDVLGAHRSRGERIVFTNGCFDILHVGHAEYLSVAACHGEVLVVGLNSDASVRAIKGPERPLTPQAERARILASLADVDYVVIFEENTPENLIRETKPDILIKGEDWRDKGVVGEEFVKSYGGQVILTPLVPGVSTSDVLRRIRAADNQAAPEDGRRGENT